MAVADLADAPTSEPMRPRQGRRYRHRATPRRRHERRAIALAHRETRMAEHDPDVAASIADPLRANMARCNHTDCDDIILIAPFGDITDEELSIKQTRHDLAEHLGTPIDFMS